MANKKEQQKISTFLKLITPEIVEVELVPLHDLNKVELLFFWRIL